MKPFPTSQEDFHELAEQIDIRICYNTHCTSNTPVTLTHWWAVEFDDGDIRFNACCTRCSQANIRSVDGMPIKNMGKFEHLKSLEVQRAKTPPVEELYSPEISIPVPPTPTFSEKPTQKNEAWKTISSDCPKPRVFAKAIPKAVSPAPPKAKPTVKPPCEQKKGSHTPSSLSLLSARQMS
jgi:hypothetical protein